MNIGLEPVAPPPDTRNQAIVNVLERWPLYLLVTIAAIALIRKL